MVNQLNMLSGTVGFILASMTKKRKHLLEKELIPRYDILLRPWSAQCDTQPIVTGDLLALIKYIKGYCCKGNTSTQDLISIYKQILNKAEPTISLKSVAQR